MSLMPLNPEAPEFVPHQVAEKLLPLKNGFVTLARSINSSNMQPTGASRDKFKTYIEFNKITSQLSDNVLQQSNIILSTSTRVIRLKKNDNDYNIEKVIEANDDMLDRTNTNIDIESGIMKPIDPAMTGLRNPVNHVSSWNVSPIIKKVELQSGTATLIAAKNITRPQLSFKDTIDNSDSLWVPKISDKPNNVKPLALNILYNDNGEAVGYEHPYKIELDIYHPKAEFLERSPKAPTFPPSLEATPLTYVDTEDALDQLVQHLFTVDEFAVDVEHHAYRTYQGITCLLQLSTDQGGDFIVDTLALRQHMHKLNVAFTDPRKLKVLHGAEMDVIWLQRDFGVYIVGLFDTHQAAKALQLTGLSLKHLLKRYCQVDVDKTYQLADWRIRPLPEELVTYARIDTHYLLYLWRRMRNDLLSAGCDRTQLLLSVFEQSRQICGLTYQKKVTDDSSHVLLYVKSRKAFNSQQMAALRLLYKWRDAQARELDESTGYLLPNQMLLSLAESLPREVQGVHACCVPMPPFVKQNLLTIHKMILSCRVLPLEPQLYQMPLSISTMLNHQAASTYAFHDLSQFPDFRDDLQIGLSVEELACNEQWPCLPDILLFEPPQKTVRETREIVSDLNVDAKSFIPPFERYKKYRSLAQIEEIKEFKQKEAKIAALGKGEELIRSEVLPQVRYADDKALRKRKISNSTKSEQTAPPKQPENYPKDKQPVATEPKQDEPKHKSYNYKAANYKKFFDDSKKVKQHVKQPKFKRHRR